MSISSSNLGTNALTYTHNPYRGGAWADYLQMLSLQNGHDRGRYNGEVNASAGNHVQQDASGHIQRHQIRSGDAHIAPDFNERLLQAYKRVGYNPRYHESSKY
jgi:hypothetical protein